MNNPGSTNLVACYEFEEASGDITDSHGNGPDVTEVGTVSRVTGVVGDAVDVDDTNYFKNDDTAEVLRLGGADFTFAAWIKVIDSTSGAGLYQDLINSGGVWNGGFRTMQAFNNDLAFILFTATNDSKTYHLTVNEGGGWIFVAWSHDVSVKNMKGWTSDSGSLVKEVDDTYTITTSQQSASSDLIIGQGISPANMQIDQLWIFDAPLGQSEIAWLYNNGSGRSYEDLTSTPTAFLHIGGGGGRPPVKLLAARYDDADYSGGVSPREVFNDLADVGVRWSLPGGLQRMEITIRAKSGFDAYDRYINHLGHRMILYDSFCDRYLGGVVYEIVPDGRFVTYVCAGTWKRLNDDSYMESDMPTTGNTDVLIEDILTDAVSVVDSDQGNIDSTTLDGTGWTPREDVGTPAGDAITELTLMGDSGGNQWDFYLVEQRFKMTGLQKPLAYFKQRLLTADPDWVFYTQDIVAGGLTMSRNIWNLKREVGIAWDRLTGTATAGSGANTLEDTGVNFINEGVRIGDRVLNVTDGNWTTVNALTSTVLTLEETGTWTTGNVYIVQLNQVQWPSSNSQSGETDLWTIYHYEVLRNSTETQAGKYEDLVLEAYDKPVQQQSFVLGSRAIRDRSGAEYPLWRPLFGTSFYFRYADKYPTLTIFGNSYDRAQTFPAVAMDYTYKDNQLRVVPGTEDDRLDILMARALREKQRVGQIINTAVMRQRTGYSGKRITSTRFKRGYR